MFCKEYVTNGFNGTQAYIAAGFSPRGAGASACEFLKRPSVQRRIEELKNEATKKFIMTRDEVLAEIKKVATSNVAHFTKQHGKDRVIDFSDTTEDQLAALSSFESETVIEQSGADEDEPVMVRKTKFRLHSKEKALDMMMRYYGAYKDKAELTGPDGTPLVPPNVVVNFVSSSDESKTP